MIRFTQRLLQRLTNSAQADRRVRSQLVIHKTAHMRLAGIDFHGGDAGLAGLRHRASDVEEHAGGADAENLHEGMIASGRAC